MITKSLLRSGACAFSNQVRSTSILRTSAFSTSAKAAYDDIIVSKAGPKENVTLITFNRPKQLNALRSSLMHELNDALEKADQDSSVGAIVLTGSNKAFAAGADIKEMKDVTGPEAYSSNFLGHWSKIRDIKKPIIAAVSGYALGGGCELAMSCDIILAAPNAVFGQPEINLGTLPGGGGSQRLTHAIGKSRAMELILTGRNFTAQEASDWGLVSRVVEEGDDKVVEEALNVAGKIASKSQIAAQAGKEAVNAAYELTLNEGLRFERRLFHLIFSTLDQKEGMGAFVEKRKPTWKNQ